jgi:dynein heavy chain
MTEKRNEARDNLKYLSTFIQYFEILYQENIQLIVDCVPKLMNAIGLIIRFSSYFNTNEKISTLFIKVIFYLNFFMSV